MRYLGKRKSVFKKCSSTFSSGAPTSSRFKDADAIYAGLDAVILDVCVIYDAEDFKIVTFNQ